MTNLRTRLARFEAPVDYGQISPWFQRVRTVVAGVIAAAYLVGAALGVPGAVPPGVAALVAMAHSVTRGRRPHSAAESLTVDAAVIAVGLGVAGHAHTALVAAAAYLVASSITFGGIKTLAASLGVYAVAIAVRPVMPLADPETLPPAGELVTWVAVAVFLAGVALSLTAAASAVYRARSRQEEALVSERRASQMKNEFVSMVTHELRTPLTNIAGFAETLNQSWGDLPAEDIDEFLGIIVSEAEHLRNLVEDVLAIPRLEAGRLLLDVTEFQLRPSAFKVANLLFPEGGDRSASVSIGGNVVVRADPNRVEQVLRNLLENARKYGGNQINVEAVPLGDEWQIVVADTGNGLPQEDRERVFTAFEQVSRGDARSDSGFGLGLAVARHLVEAMGGRIWYEPGFPVGARFCFTLPAAAAAPAAGTSADVA